MDIIYQFYLNFLQNLGVPDWIILLLWYVFPFVGTIFVVFLVTFICNFTQKKLVNRLYLKNKPTKENITVTDENQTTLKLTKEATFSEKIITSIAPIIVFVAIICAWSVIPFGNKFISVSSSVSLFVFFAMLLVSICGVLLFGAVAKNDIRSEIALRYSATIFSFSLALVFSAFGAVVLASSLNLNEIVLAQSGSMGAIGWFITPSFIGFVVYFVASVAIAYPIEEQELFDNLSGIKLLLFASARYAAVFALAVVSVCLFFGGYLSPFGFYLSEVYQFDFVLNNSAVYLEQVVWLILKSSVIVFAMMCFRNSFSGLKTGNVVKFSWKVLIPLAALNFFIVCIIKPFWGGA